MTIVQIPCLSCRAGTPADDEAAAVACAACGAPLPAPAARAWMLLRGGSQPFGPYAIAEVARFLAEGRLQLSDEIWHEGATVRLALHRLPAVDLAAGPIRARRAGRAGRRERGESLADAARAAGSGAFPAGARALRARRRAPGSGFISSVR